MSTDTITSFKQFNLKEALLRGLDDVGYETPSPIQAETIPLLLDGRDVLGQAQTGTGKTAAFALPLLSNLDLKQHGPQIVVLAPTRELAIQVSEAVKKYATHLPGFQVLPIYGGQEYGGQIRALKRGVHVVVGTPGRIMDHMRRGTLKLDKLSALVLDEADEMLRMGFIDDVEWILEQTPEARQIALFSATMPSQIRRIATKYLKDPAQVTIKVKTSTADTIRQRYWPVAGVHKLDALTRILEAEPFDATIIFVRTKIATVELCEKLQARGYAAVALNGDIPQNTREQTIIKLKNGKLDVLVATDVAARGLDVERVTHVINYDIPHDTEAYVHRVGRTGRAGRKGEAILFVAPRERRMLRSIERATRQPIEMMELPSSEQINDKRITAFLQRITDTIATGDLGVFPGLIEQYQQQYNVPAQDIAAALAKMLQGAAPFLLDARPGRKIKEHRRDKEQDRPQANERPRDSRPSRDARPERPAAPAREKFQKPDRQDSRPAAHHNANDIPAIVTPSRKHEAHGNNEHVPADKPKRPKPNVPMERFRIEVGSKHDVQPGNIVGAIANEAGMDSEFIGRIEIREDHSLLDLPEGMPKAIFKDLRKVWVCGQQLNISRLSDPPPASDRYPGKTGDSARPGPAKRPGSVPPHGAGKGAGSGPGPKKPRTFKGKKLKAKPRGPR